LQRFTDEKCDMQCCQPQDSSNYPLLQTWLRHIDHFPPQLSLILPRKSKHHKITSPEGHKKINYTHHIENFTLLAHNVGSKGCYGGGGGGDNHCGDQPPAHDTLFLTLLYSLEIPIPLDSLLHCFP
jgi:hypothetical protein